MHIRHAGAAAGREDVGQHDARRLHGAGVADDVAPTHGTVSSEMAKGMARGARELTGTDYAVSTTGVTGPSAGRSGIAIGTFWIGLSVKDGQDTAIEIHLDGDRDACKRGAAQAALDLLGKELSGG